MPEIVIVIGRQYGSGGRALGKNLAKRLSIPYYDKELLSEAASRLGFRADLLERADEKPPSTLRSLLGASVGSPAWFTQGALHQDALYQLQSDVIRAIIEQGSCVIVGRTADYVARNHPGMVSIFVHADLPNRIQKVVSRESNLDAESAKDKINKMDSARKAYYNYFTGRNWGEASNYHLSLSSSHLSAQALEDVIIAYLQARFPEIQIS